MYRTPLHFPGEFNAMLHSFEMPQGIAHHRRGHARRGHAPWPSPPGRWPGYAGRESSDLCGGAHGALTRIFGYHRRSRRPAQTRRRAPGPGWRTTPPRHFTSVSHGPGFGIVVIQNHAVPVAGAILRKPALSWRYTAFHGAVTIQMILRNVQNRRHRRGGTARRSPSGRRTPRRRSRPPARMPRHFARE